MCEMNTPSHYDVDIDVIDFSRIFLTEEEFIGAMKFNALKYFFRQGRKANTDDSKKCLDYLIRIYPEKICEIEDLDKYIGFKEAEF